MSHDNNEVESVRDGRFIRKRGILLGRLERILKFVREYDKETGRLAEVSVRATETEGYYKEFVEIQDRLMCSSNEELVDGLEAHFIECDTIYYDIKSYFTELLESDTSSSSVNSQRFAVPVAVPVQAALKLPEIAVPKFDGDMTKWTHFKESFAKMIVEHPNLSDIQRFHYLKCALGEEPKKIVDLVEYSGPGFHVAWHNLDDRYNDTRMIIETHVAGLFRLKQVNKESTSELKDLVDNVHAHVEALRHLDQPVNSWDAILVHLIVGKISNEIRKPWEMQLKSKELPTYKHLMTFLQNRLRILESIDNSKKWFKPELVSRPDSIKGKKSVTLAATTAGEPEKRGASCRVCKKDHELFSCDIFAALSMAERYRKARSFRICFNCLMSGHFGDKCTAPKCETCGKAHHMLLHTENKERHVATSSNVQNTCHVSHDFKLSTDVLLSTAIVQVKDSSGNWHLCRALLDSASQSNFITDRLRRQLRLAKLKVSVPVQGIGESTTEIKTMVNTEMKSRTSDFVSCLDFLILKNITGEIPSRFVNTSRLQLPSGMQLADPEFNRPKKVDMLIGAEIFLSLFLDGKIDLGKNSPDLHDTLLGWIISGSIITPSDSPIICNVAVELDQLERFWSIEEIDNKENTIFNLSKEESDCEAHFVENVRRDSDGRFIVKIPVKASLAELGDSRKGAIHRFYNLEKKLVKNSDFRQHYTEFMEEYESAKHMEQVKTDDVADSVYYMPHHAVLRPSSLTTKLRTVFDASFKTSSGMSLNSIMMVGPKIQDDLFAIVVRFRKHKFVLTADIRKMYRQIRIDETDADLQRIFWRKGPNEEVKSYRLLTVTYGTAAAPFLAVRCLKQLSIEEGENFPAAASVVLKDFYMDDLMTGADSEAELRRIQIDVTAMLKSAQFELHKWCSNSQNVLESIPEDLLENSNSFKIDFDDTIKALGLYWNPKEDLFMYRIQLMAEDDKPMTKRNMLSIIAAIFDPLGLLGPFIIIAKIFIQTLWRDKIGWDKPVAENLRLQWMQYRAQFCFLNELKVGRRIVCDDVCHIELHGFGDASETAYGACIYIRSIDSAGNISVHLLSAKSKVAPMHKVSLPRLELCASLLLAKLYDKVIKSLDMEFNSCHLWSDSTIALSWIGCESARWNTFVANRVSDTQRLSKGCVWRHVAGKENPADVISRGETAEALVESKLWWSGPWWLAEPVNEWPTFKLEVNMPELPEQKKIVLVVTKPDYSIIEKYSSLSVLQRVAAWCLRFCRNSKPDATKLTGPLSVEELHKALLACIRMLQLNEFAEEIKCLEKKKNLPVKSKLISLNPFWDPDAKILRVGGRLEHSSADYDKKHPILLPAHNNLVKMIARSEHVRNLHQGPQALLFTLRQVYWRLRGRDLCRETVHKCITCFRSHPKEMVQIMGNLPRSRVEPARPFVNVGIDYAGPFYVRASLNRKAVATKAYVAVFICLCTKAIHLELVGDMTSEGFLGALKRFMGRRGKCAEIFSDNGTTFVGADSELQELRELFMSNEHQKILNTALVSDKITWHFIPPRAPNFGGLWEAGVKSMKSHLKKVISPELHLTYEQFNTVLVNIEAILNSRPLFAMSEDPNDLTALSPGHFLIGDCLISNLEPNLMELPLNRLGRWQVVEQIRQHYWRRWSHDFLVQQQQRSKWTKSSDSITAGTLVLIKEDNQPPMVWPLARVVTVHPGTDGVVRVVTLRTSKGEVKPSISKVCPLPVNDGQYPEDVGRPFQSGRDVAANK